MNRPDLGACRPFSLILDGVDTLSVVAADSADAGGLLPDPSEAAGTCELCGVPVRVPAEVLQRWARSRRQVRVACTICRPFVEAACRHDAELDGRHMLN